MQKIIPFLWFNDQAEEAVRFYTSIFKDSKIGTIARFGDDTPGPKGKVMTVAFELAGKEFVALNGGPEFSFTPAISFYVSCQTNEELDTLWINLCQGGNILMELAQYPFSQKFGWVMDQFGVSWQLDLTNQSQKISPYLMFVGEQNGRAKEAIQFYTSLFNHSAISHIEYYGRDQDEPEGLVMHARFSLEGQEFMALDSSRDHHFTFTPAISFYVNCLSQEEVDYFWNKLSEDGEEGQCGWLTDPYGVSWQIVPAILPQLMSDPDAEKAGRVTQAMLRMTKLDISLLQQAYNLA